VNSCLTGLKWFIWPTSVYISYDNSLSHSRYKGPVLGHFYFRSGQDGGPEVEMVQNWPFIPTSRFAGLMVVFNEETDVHTSWYMYLFVCFLISKLVTQGNSFLQVRQHTSTKAVGYLSKARSQKPLQAVLLAIIFGKRQLSCRCKQATLPSSAICQLLLKEIKWETHKGYQLR